MFSASKRDVLPVAIVVDAAGDLGATVADALAANHKVLVVGGQGVSAVAEMIRGQAGDAESLTIDMTDPEELAGIGDFAEEHLGPPSIYVHCQSMAQTEATGWLETTVEVWDRVFAEEVRSVWLGCRAVMSRLRANAPAKIIVVGSDGAASGMPPVHQATATSALIGVVRSLAREVGDDDIAVNLICRSQPGGPPLVTSALGRAVSGGDVADAVMFLCSADSEFITGQSWLINGGSWLQ